MWVYSNLIYHHFNNTTNPPPKLNFMSLLKIKKSGDFIFTCYAGRKI